MAIAHSTGAGRTSETAAEFYRSALLHLNAGQVPYLVGGAYAMEYVTGIGHRTKDLDLFVQRRDAEGLLSALRELGCTTKPAWHWVSKAIRGEHFIDVIFGGGNGQI